MQVLLLEVFEEKLPKSVWGVGRLVAVVVRCVRHAVSFLPLVICFFPMRWTGLGEVWWHWALWTIEESGPAFVKFSQWAATRSDGACGHAPSCSPSVPQGRPPSACAFRPVTREPPCHPVSACTEARAPQAVFPAVMCARLSLLHSRARPHHVSASRVAIEASFGPASVLIDDGEPIGSGCIAQVPLLLTTVLNTPLTSTCFPLGSLGSPGFGDRHAGAALGDSDAVSLPCRCTEGGSQAVRATWPSKCCTRGCVGPSKLTWMSCGWGWDCSKPSPTCDGSLWVAAWRSLRVSCNSSSMWDLRRDLPSCFDTASEAVISPVNAYTPTSCSACCPG